MTSANDIRRMKQTLREIGEGCSDDHFIRWHLGFDARGEKHNDAGGGHSWSKCFCTAGKAREALKGG